MASILFNLGLISGQNAFLAHFIIYLATIFLGNISALASFFLAFRGYLGTWGVPFLMITILAADISGDLLWYALGRTLRDTRFGNFIHNHLPGHEKIDLKIQKKGARLIFFSKFIYASSFPIIFSIGWSRLDFKKFFKTSVLSIIAWVPLLAAISYGLFSGISPLRAIKVFKRFEIIILLAIVCFIFLNYALTKITKRFLRNGTD